MESSSDREDMAAGAYAAASDAVEDRYASADVADNQFIDDLIAAVRLKNFLIGRGVDVPAEVSQGLARLSTRFPVEMSNAEMRFANRR